MTPQQAQLFLATQDAIVKQLRELDGLIGQIEGGVQNLDNLLRTFDQINQLVLRRDHIRLKLRLRTQVRPVVMQRMARVLGSDGGIDGMLDASLPLATIAEQDRATLAQAIDHIRERLA